MENKNDSNKNLKKEIKKISSVLNFLLSSAFFLLILIVFLYSNK
tara:strand:- start:504 stop:635 length:132 start_codon:yes stop_codon:yes gene_type:complete